MLDKVGDEASVMSAVYVFSIEPQLISSVEATYDRSEMVKFEERGNIPDFWG